MKKKNLIIYIILGLIIGFHLLMPKDDKYEGKTAQEWAKIAMQYQGTIKQKDSEIASLSASIKAEYTAVEYWANRPTPTPQTKYITNTQYVQSDPAYAMPTIVQMAKPPEPVQYRANGSYLYGSNGTTCRANGNVLNCQ